MVGSFVEEAKLELWASLESNLFTGFDVVTKASSVEVTVTSGNVRVRTLVSHRAIERSSITVKQRIVDLLRELILAIELHQDDDGLRVIQGGRP